MPVGVWIALLVGVAGVFALTQKPFQDTRPPNVVLPLGKGAPDDGQALEVRFWEDPLSAVALARKSGDKDAYDAESVRTAVQANGTHKGKTLVLGVMVNGGPYTDNIETRRRARYAVLAGLYRSGFIPKNTDHLGYFSTATSVEVSAGGKGPKPEPAHDAAAFEWFKRDSTVVGARPTLASASSGAGDSTTCDPLHLAPAAQDNELTRCDKVLVLWLDQDGLTDQPIRKISQILRRVSGPPDPLVNLVILGPANSDGLRAMYKEMRSTDEARAAHTPDGDWPTDLMSMSIYSPRATASDAVLQAVATSQVPFDQQLLDSSSGKLMFFRAVTDDQRVADAVLRELKHRGIEKSEIAVVAERDTLYARGMGSYFGQCRNRARADPQPPEAREPATDQIRCFTYLRGLDGLTATAETPASETHSSQGAKSDAAPPADSVSDASIGASQLDYLRRLAGTIATVRQSRARIKAIGVISSDVYDKLLVLQALRSTLPNVTYFTFDLDGRMLEPVNLKWTRQLLVGSSLGLSLRGSLQGDIPPFRDSYQTTTFFATQVAAHRFVSSPNARAEQLGNKPPQASPAPALPMCPKAAGGKGDDRVPLEAEPKQPGLQWTAHPRMFEIGRSQAFDLIGDPDPQNCVFDGCCQSIGASRQGWLWDKREWPANALVVGIIASALCLIVGGVAFGTRGILGMSRTRWLPLLGKRRWDNGKAWAIFVSVVILGSLGAWWLLAGWFTRWWWRVPTPLFGGASDLTAPIMDAVAILTAIVLVVRGQRKLYDNAESISREFGFQNSARDLVLWHKNQLMPRRWRQRGLALFWFPIRPLPRQSGIALASKNVSPLEAIIAQYLHRGTALARLVRVSCVTLISGIALALVELILGITILRLSLSVLSAVSLFATQFLIFWCADALFLSRSFLLALWRDKPQWPSAALTKEAANIGVRDTRLVLWLDLRLIARRTTAVAQLVWYPSVIIAALALLSLTSDFKDLQFANNPLALLVGAAFVIASAVALRRSAEFWRGKVRHQLEDERLRAQGSANDRSATQLDSLLERVKSLNEGAFAPYSEQPIVRAVLVPAITYGATLGLQRTHLGP
jgi:hypothetical protein